MNRRDIDISTARIAGYHDDKGRFTRLVVESRVRRDVLDEAWREGRRQRESGMPCDCYSCGVERWRRERRTRLGRGKKSNGEQSCVREPSKGGAE